MREIVLELKFSPEVSVEGDSISPDSFACADREEIRRMPLLYGSRTITIGDMFDVSGEKAARLSLAGDFRKVKRIGENMSGGEIEIHGAAGMYLGAGMSGGRISVHGDADDYAGARMSGGMIAVDGDCGSLLGAGRSGGKQGMDGGVILIRGDAGPYACERMRRGVAIVLGRAGDFAGSMMLGGSLLLAGGGGRGTGAGMSRGTILAFNGVDVLPTFRYCCTHNPVSVRLLLGFARSAGVCVPESWEGAPYRRYMGDVTDAISKGELLERAG